MKTNLWQLSALELINAYRKKEISPVEVVVDVFARIEKFNPSLSAFLALNYDDAIDSAKNAERLWLNSEENGLL